MTAQKEPTQRMKNKPGWFPWPSTEPKEETRLKDIVEGLKEGSQDSIVGYKRCTVQEQELIKKMFNYSVGFKPQLSSDRL